MDLKEKLRALYRHLYRLSPETRLKTTGGYVLREHYTQI